MKTIHKKALSRRGETVLSLPSGAFITRVDLQDGEPHAWVFLDDAAPATQRVCVRIVGTGREVPDGYFLAFTFFEHGVEFVWREFVWHAIVKWEQIDA